ncbi:MAG: cupin domain-containing protein [Alphaproteobacteria bacterium]
MPQIETGNLFENIPTSGDLVNEDIGLILARPGVKIERIVSHGQASPPDFWYDQAWHEWVIVLSGCARLKFEGEAEARLLSAGDYVFIPARQRHRVDWTSEDDPTVWLAVHFEA